MAFKTISVRIDVKPRPMPRPRCGARLISGRAVGYSYPENSAAIKAHKAAIVGGVTVAIQQRLHRLTCKAIHVPCETASEAEAKLVGKTSSPLLPLGEQVASVPKEDRSLGTLEGTRLSLLEACNSVLNVSGATGCEVFCAGLLGYADHLHELIELKRNQVPQSLVIEEPIAPNSFDVASLGVCPPDAVVLLSAKYVFGRQPGRDHFGLTVAQRPEGEYFNAIKKDSDNIIKLVKDALANVAYHDDSHVCAELSTKVHSKSFLGGKSGRKRCSEDSHYRIRIAYLTGDDRFGDPDAMMARFQGQYTAIEDHEDV